MNSQPPRQSGAETRSFARVYRQGVAEVFFPAEVLPVGVPYPACHNGFIRFVEGMFEVVQSNHEPDRDAPDGPPLRTVRQSELLLHSSQSCPLTVQGVTLVQYLLQAQAKQVIAGTRLLLFRLHDFTRNQGEITSILAISSALVYPSMLISVRVGRVFRED